MKVMVIGSLASKKDFDKIKYFQKKISELNFEIINQLDLDYRDIENFYGEKDFAKRIVMHDISKLMDSDIVIALGEIPSWGTSMEILISKLLGKKVIFFVKENVRSPWPVYFSDKLVRGEKELFEFLTSLRSK
ncbi:MAG: hypothetical protein ACE5K4_06600 [Candidatus Hydrothermarchaeota archaeon]